MNSFITTDKDGNFVLDGRPWFLHGATYFGRRPGTCGGDWLGENFEHNLAFVDRDFETMHRLGINTLGLFVSNPSFFEGLNPVAERFEQLEYFLDRVKAAGMYAVMFDLFVFSPETWCSERGVEPGDGLWNPAVNPEAERANIATKTAFRRRFASRTEIAGWATGCPRFFRFGFDVPAVGNAWNTWLHQRFDWDFERIRATFSLEADETDWNRVRMPTEMDPYFNHENPRSYEFAVMQQTLVTKALNRIIRGVRPVTPNHLMITDMEGCCFSGGHLTSFIPEHLESDALWLESYHWEGTRSYSSEEKKNRQPRMPTPVADKPSVEIVNAAGYVQMLTRLMRSSGKPLILCHGTDIGEKKRGVRDESDQELLVARYNTFFVESGGSAVNYWCWSDDELSKTYTRQFGVEYGTDTDPSDKKYWQAGETMGIVRYDGSERPVTRHVAGLSAERHARSAKTPATDVLVLLPSPVFQSVYRYRANQTAFGVFTSLARQGVLADAAMTSAGEDLLKVEELTGRKLVILGVNSYTRDHPEIPDRLLEYVRLGGTLCLPVASHDTLLDAWLVRRESSSLRVLTGTRSCVPVNAPRLEAVAGRHPAFETGPLSEWALDTDEPSFFAETDPGPEAEVLATAGGRPLLYRHQVGEGTVYVFTWNLDVFIFDRGKLDHYSDWWDWIWRGIVSEIRIQPDMNNPIRRIVLEMMSRYDSSRR